MVGGEEKGNFFSSRERAKNLLERGFSREAVAVYGGSVELVREILSRRVVPSLAIEERILPYQQVGDKELYFLLPFWGRIPPGLTAWRQLIEANFDNLTSVNRIMTAKKQISLAAIYAGEKALRDSFFSLTGEKADNPEILFLANQLVPQALRYHKCSQRINEELLERDLETADRGLVAEILGRVEKRQLHEALAASLARKGVLLFLDARIFGYPIIAGEMEMEIGLLTPKPLPIEAISGIKALSEEDKYLLLG